MGVTQVLTIIIKNNVYPKAPHQGVGNKLNRKYLTLPGRLAILRAAVFPDAKQLKESS